MVSKRIACIDVVIFFIFWVTGIIASISSTQQHQDDVFVTKTMDLDASSSKVRIDENNPINFVDTTTNDACLNVVKKIWKETGDNFNTLASLLIHRNGDPDPCSDVSVPFSAKAIAQTLYMIFPFACTDPTPTNEDDEESVLDRYQLDTLLTEYVATSFLEQRGRKECNSTSVDPNDYGMLHDGFYGHCDMGEEKTVMHNDHNDLIRVPKTKTLPCRWYTREGLVVSSLEQLVQLIAINGTSNSPTCADSECPAQVNDEKEFHLYSVPAGRVFMFGPKFIGEEFVLNHVHDSMGNVITLKVISLEPRVFDIFNFFSLQESESLMQKSIQETSPTFRFHRSTTGTAGASVFSKRTSENAWDTNGETASIVKR
jgi:hypothetical protein